MNMDDLDDASSLASQLSVAALSSRSMRIRIACSSGPAEGNARDRRDGYFLVDGNVMNGNGVLKLTTARGWLNA